MIKNVHEYLQHNFLIFDGAMGTMLQRSGLPAGECPERWNITNSEPIQNIHQMYIDAGAQIIVTNTFGGSRIKLATYGLDQDCKKINYRGVKIARDAAAGKALVAASMGPTGKLLQPLGELDFEGAYAAFKEQVEAFVEAGADLIILETMVDLQEARAALIAAKENSTLPVICSMTFDERLRTLTGSDPITVATVLESLGADIIGANCSGGPEQLLPVIEQMASVCNKPLIIQPNAGLPELIDGETVFRLSPESFAEFAPQLVKAGARCLGGCCGTTPEHIHALKKSLANQAPVLVTPLPITRIAGRTETIFIGHGLPPVIVGERINPTGRPKLADDIRTGRMELVLQEAVEQLRAGAHALDVNMGVPGINEPAAMKRAVQIIQSSTGVPLSIDTTDAHTLETGLRQFCGKALINSINAEHSALEKLLPIAKKYGATILGLPLGGTDLPLRAEDRMIFARKIINAAREIGINQEDIILDGLCLTVGAQQEYAFEAVRAIQLYKSTYDIPTALGVSNVSFGMPRRDLLNSTFFAMTLAAGLNVAIMNPYDQRMKETLYSANALMNVDPAGKQYIDFAKQNATVDNEPKTGQTAMEKIRKAVIQGEKGQIHTFVSEALLNDEGTLSIVNDALIPAMEHVGNAYFKGEAYLPQVLMAAEAMRAAFNALKQLNQGEELPTQGTIVLATVKGDIHDLGKNIVGAILENNGIRVIDLGKDVSAEAIVAAAVAEKADLIGLSALMTTTMPEMRTVVELCKVNKIGAKIIVGGAVVTQEYSDDIGANAYAKDALEALAKAKELLR